MTQYWVCRAGLVDLTEVQAGCKYDQNMWDSHRINKIFYESNNKYTCAAVDHDSWNCFKLVLTDCAVTKTKL